MIAGSPTLPTAVVRYDVTSGTFETLKRSLEADVDPGYLSIPTPIEFPTENGLTAHGFLYLPRNKDFVAPEGELPPLLVQSHGGPTGATSTALSLPLQFWTSPRICCARRQLRRQHRLWPRLPAATERRWGIVDVDDHVNAASYLIEQRSRRPGAHRHPRLERQRLHDAGHPGVPRSLPRRRQPLRHQRSGDDDDRHPQVRVTLPRRTDRAISRSERHLRRSLADPSSGGIHRAPDPLPGKRRHGGAARSGGDDVRGHGSRAVSRWRWSSSPAKGTGSAAPRTSGARSKESSISTGRSSASRRTARSSR